ncbi:hypothetical protein OG500_12690 [Kitasatospora sp. NBC_01250]|uniref:hypothetical protein n=1 Tax=unclassified Kitasatospora TaxID=2633591 RepID=UPI002E155817|nr:MULTISPECIES: hypothetical protein [unclassified Kitasatospora]WSJ66982.1 hypothetical protein OG294_13145 [Kitasatospora sp. NBC_01302]
MAARRRKNPDHPSATGPDAQPGESLLPADFELADLYGAHGSDEEEDLDDLAVLVPPVRLLPEAELAAAALAVPLIAHAVKLARWSAPTRPVDELGDLLDADREAAARFLGLAPAEGEVSEEAVLEAMRVWSLASDLELVLVAHDEAGQRSAGPSQELAPVEQGDPESVLELWLAAADVIAELAVEIEPLDAEPDAGERADDERAEELLAQYEEVQEQAAELLDEALQVLYEATAFAEPGQETVPLGVLAALLVVPEGEEPDEEMLGDITDVMVALDPMLADLAEIGLLEYQPIDPELFDEEEGEEAAQGAAAEQALDEAEAARFGLVKLTPLGQYGVRQWLLDEGYEAPLIGELATGDAAALLQGIAEAGNVLPEQEIRVWLADREPLTAARELLAAARGEDRTAPLRRMLAQLALGELGEAAEPAAREVLGDPELGGGVRAWLVSRGAEDVPAPDRTMVLWTTVDTFAAQLLDSEGDAELLRELISGMPVTDNPASFFGELWRVEHPYTARVLEAVGELHLDRQVAKEARKAAFKARSRQ